MHLSVLLIQPISNSCEHPYTFLSYRKFHITWWKCNYNTQLVFINYRISRICSTWPVRRIPLILRSNLKFGLLITNVLNSWGTCPWRSCWEGSWYQKVDRVGPLWCCCSRGERKCHLFLSFQGFGFSFWAFLGPGGYVFRSWCPRWRSVSRCWLFSRSRCCSRIWNKESFLRCWVLYHSNIFNLGR